MQQSIAKMGIDLGLVSDLAIIAIDQDQRLVIE